MSVDPRAEVEHRLRSLLDERLDGLSRRIREWLEESHARAGTLAEIIEEARREPLPVDPSPVGGAAIDPESGLSDLAGFAQDVESSADQAAILGRLVSGAASQASRVLLFVVRNESFIGWTARGFAQEFSPRRITTPVAGDTLLTRAHGTCAPVIETPPDSPGNEQLARALGDEPPQRMMAVPLWVRDRIAAILYADTVEPAGAWRPEAIRVMASLAALSLEAIPARTKYPRPSVAPAAIIEKAPTGPREAVRAPQGPTHPSGAPPAEQVDPEEGQHHEEARRFARLLVSEILLYNEKEIEEGRRNKDLYERMKEDIDRSRQMYLRRVSSHLPGGPDYFHQELVRTLADGDESALNVPWA